MFSPVLDMLAERSKDLVSLLQTEVRTYIEVLLFFAKHTVLAEVIIYSNNLKLNLKVEGQVGRVWHGQTEQADLWHFNLARTS